MSKKQKKNKNEKTHMDPIGIIVKFIKSNWVKLLSFVIPISIISTIVIKATMLKLYGVPKEFIIPMLKPSTWDLINSFWLLLASILFMLLIELIIQIAKKKLVRGILYLIGSLSISLVIAKVYEIELFHTIMIFLFCYSGTFVYLKLIRSTFEKRSREIAQRAYASNSIKIRRFVFISEVCFVLGGYLLLLLWMANVGVILPKNHTTIDDKIIVSMSFDKYLVSDYTIEYSENGLQYILINTNEMDIVKTGKLGQANNVKTFILGKKLSF